MKNKSKNIKGSQEKLITRKEAILKTSKYVALTAMATFVILNPKKAQAQSTPEDPSW
jgi:hypothetical protein